MKAYCTGNRRGIGYAVCERIAASGYEVIGLNRPDCDLSIDLEPFVKDDFDVYINNAHYEWSQTDLLYKLWEKNKDRNCMIMNISSGLSDVAHSKVWRYPIYKNALDQASVQLQQIESNCRVVLVKPGLMDTGRVPINGRPTVPVDYVADILHSVITAPDNIYHRVISLKAKKLMNTTGD
jgi:NAD(P)-dependent dehydrogenase (short-subunit alcohol dehydrogenase family)